MYGPTPRLTVWYANKNPEQLDVAKLAEFVTEEHNPANCKHIARIVVELPSPRLQDGVVLVDTPGLGSLATSGAAETLAYLPRCDLGVVLIDAGSTITEDDLSTIRALYEAGVPVSALLSKSDLLSADDRARVSAYVSQQIAAQLGLNLSVHPVSVQRTHAVFLEDWYTRDILPLYERHQQLTEESLRRKIGSLRDAVETALRIRLERAGTRSHSSQTDVAGIDARLRNVVGRFAETRKICSDVTHEIDDVAERGLAMASSHLVDKWLGRDVVSPTIVVRDALGKLAAAQASHLLAPLEDLARELTEAVRTTADDLAVEGVHESEDLTAALKEMPGLDLGTWEVNIAPSFRLKLSGRMEARRIEQCLRQQIGAAVSKAFYNFGRMLDAWARRALSELQVRFDTHADGYRAHLKRLSGGERASEAEDASIRRDLEQLTQSQTSTPAEITPAS
jgi:hypothetical protein